MPSDTRDLPWEVRISMSKDTSATATVNASFLERLGDGLSAFSDNVSRFLTRLMGSSNERYVRKLGYIRAKTPGSTHTVIPGSLLEQINELEPQMQPLSDEELKGATARLRAKLAQGATLEDLLPEAFAACREAAKRTKNMRHFDVQMLGGVVLHRGNIAEMVTGEGKTLVATLPAFLNGLEAKGVHVVTVNDYLARRDCEWMLPIYRALGMNAGFIQSDMDPVARRTAYDCDITYGTNSEFGFDYLRDNMKPARWGDPQFDPHYHQCQKALHYAVIDEVDNILIDEARTPLIISGQAHGDIKRFAKANEVAVALSELQKKESDPNKYFEIKEKEQTCHLTDEGIHKAEELAGVESFYTAGNMEWPHLIDNSLKAHHLYKKDKRYAVTPNEENVMSIIIIDEFTGRLMHGRQWSDGLHQAVEAKHAREGVKIKEETQTLATVTLQNFFKLYKKLAGMTGTAMTEADEFWKIYHLEVIAIPTNMPLSRVNHPDVIFRTEKEKWTASIDEIVEVHKQGRPILIGTTDVDKSLKLADMLKRRGIRHELLNALPEHAARESEIVAQAGRVGAVTIATNMAGRGTDIILGGNAETMAWAQLKNKYASRLDVPEAEWKQTVDEIERLEKMKEEGRKVAEMGGLHIIGTERHDARRIDNQLRGRAGRQGDPGSSRFYLSLEDDLMRIFAGEWVSGLLQKLGMEEGQAIESSMVSRRIAAAQKKVEERHFDSRKHLLEYDEVMDTQRKNIYGFRQRILEDANCKTLILEMLQKQVTEAVDEYTHRDYGASNFAKFAVNRVTVDFEASDFRGVEFEQAVNDVRERANQNIDPILADFIEENLGAEDAKDWNWQALANKINEQWDLKVNERQLKQLGKESLHDFLREQAVAAVEQIDLSDGRQYLDPLYGIKSICELALRKFMIRIKPEDLAGKSAADIKQILMDAVMLVYREKEIQFPVMAAMARYMTDRTPGVAPGGQRYNREGLYHWAMTRFPGTAAKLTEEDFRTQSRGKLMEMLLAVSRTAYPTKDQRAVDEKLEESLHGTTHSEAEDAKELAEWAKTEMGLEVSEAAVTGVTYDRARQVLWNAFDFRYRAEMRGLERSLLLYQVDSAWKNHLAAMDSLRSGIGLYGYAQEDPKIKYKQEGMKEFKGMWEGIEDRVTDTVFRMEETEAFQESLWSISATVHESAPRTMVPQQEQQFLTNAGGSDKKAEPIRNRGEKVGRNDPCPCGSGKKYKNCHMRQAAV